MEEHRDRGGNVLEFISGANEGLAALEPSQGFDDGLGYHFI